MDIHMFQQMNTLSVLKLLYCKNVKINKNALKQIDGICLIVYVHPTLEIMTSFRMILLTTCIFC